VLTVFAEGVNFDNEGPVDRKRHQLQRAWLAGSAGSVAASCRCLLPLDPGVAVHPSYGRLLRRAHRGTVQDVARR
jgi:hypothetical protein